MPSCLRCIVDNADIVGFTDMSTEVPPIAVMTFLNDLYTAYDALCDMHGVYKVETVGDCYVSPCLLPPVSQGLIKYRAAGPIMADHGRKCHCTEQHRKDVIATFV